MVDEVGPLASTTEVAAAVSRLRAAGHSPELVSAVVGQAHLRVRAAAKFGPFADRMLFTRAGLEQATRLEVAARHAGRFRDAGVQRVADLGCGIGGDALGLAGLGLDVLAVDADETTAALAAYNLAPFGEAVTVRSGLAEETDLDGWDAVWLDPARRTAGHSETSRTRPEDWSPSLEWAFALAERMPVGIKLGPGLDRDLIPDGVEAQWISVDGSTVELVLWSGALRRDGVSILLTTHLMDEAEHLADDLVIIDHGQVVASGTPTELTRRGAEGQLRFSAPSGLDLSLLQMVLPEGFDPVESSPGSYLLEGTIDPQVLATVTSWCARLNVLATDLRVEQRSLEDVFLDLTGRELRG